MLLSFVETPDNIEMTSSLQNSLLVIYGTET